MSTDILDMATLTWSRGADLPGVTYYTGARTVAYGDSFLLVGGKTYKPTKDENGRLGGGPDFVTGVLEYGVESGEWIARDENLVLGREDLVVIPMPYR